MKFRIVPPYRPALKTISDIPDGALFILCDCLDDFYIKVKGSDIPDGALFILCDCLDDFYIKVKGHTIIGAEVVRLRDGLTTALRSDTMVCVPEKIVVTQ